MSYGDTWSNTNNSKNNATYNGVAMSSDGQKIIVTSTTTTSPVQISLDGGVGWSLGGGGSFAAYGCACSNDFSRIYIPYYNGLYRSLDGGASVQSVFTSSSVQYVSCSADGMIVYAGQSGGTAGQMFRRSMDGGNTWSFIDTSHTAGHYKISCSSTGQYVLVQYASSPYGLRSNDYGATWSDLPLTSSGGTSAMSADGQHQYMAHPLSSSTFLLSSHDYGATWTDQQIGGSTGAIVSCSADGRYVVVSGGTLQNTQIFASTNFGNAFYQLATGLTHNIFAIDMSDSGQIITGASSSGYPVATCHTSLLNIIEISPTSGPVAGGTPVTITGTGFEAGAIATLDGVALVGQTVVNSYTITGTTAAHVAGAVDLVVTNP